MSNIEHLLENAIIALENNVSLENWANNKINKNMLETTKTTKEEFWQMAQYVLYTYVPYEKAKLLDEIEKAYGYPIPEEEVNNEKDVLRSEWY